MYIFEDIYVIGFLLVEDLLTNSKFSILFTAKSTIRHKTNT